MTERLELLGHTVDEEVRLAPSKIKVKEEIPEPKNIEV